MFWSLTVPLLSWEPSVAFHYLQYKFQILIEGHLWNSYSLLSYSPPSALYASQPIFQPDWKMSCVLCWPPQIRWLGQSSQLDALFFHLSGWNLTHPSKVIWNTLFSVKLFLTPSTRNDFRFLWAQMSMALYPSQGNNFLCLFVFFSTFYYIFIFFIFLVLILFLFLCLCLDLAFEGKVYFLPVFLFLVLLVTWVFYNKDVWFSWIFIEWMDG